MHPRQKIRSKLLEILTNNTSAESRVFFNPTPRTQDENLPALNIFYVSEDIEQLNVAPLEFKRSLKLIFEAVASGLTEKEMTDRIDQLSDEVEQILIEENALVCEVDEADRVKLSGADFEFRGDGETPIGACRTEVEVIYRSELREPAALDEFKTIDAEWNINKDNDTDDPSGEIVTEAEDSIDIDS